MNRLLVRGTVALTATAAAAAVARRRLAAKCIDAKHWSAKQR